MQGFPHQSKRVALVINTEALNQLRQHAGIKTDHQLAALLGMDDSTISRILNGHSYPSNEFMARCVKAFPSTSLDVLFRRVDVPEEEVA